MVFAVSIETNHVSKRLIVSAT